MKPAYSVTIGVFLLIVGLLMLSGAIWRHHPLQSYQIASVTLMLVFGAGILLREYRARSRR